MYGFMFESDGSWGIGVGVLDNLVDTPAHFGVTKSHPLVMWLRLSEPTRSDSNCSSDVDVVGILRDLLAVSLRCIS
jgi:hypothetical protein